MSASLTVEACDPQLRASILILQVDLDERPWAEVWLNGSVTRVVVGGLPTGSLLINQKGWPFLLAAVILGPAIGVPRLYHRAVSRRHDQLTCRDLQELKAHQGRLCVKYTEQAAGGKNKVAIHYRLTLLVKAVSVSLHSSARCHQSTRQGLIHI